MHQLSEKNKKLILSIIIVILLIFIIYASLPFISAFFGAIILAYIFYPLNKKLRKRGFSPRTSSLIILIVSLIIVIIPVIFIINGLIKQIAYLPGQIEKIREIRNRINEISPFDIEVNINQVINQLTSILTRSITPIFNNILNAFIILFLLFFLLYYLLLYSDEIKEIIRKYLPFDDKTNTQIINQFKQVTNSTVIGTFFIAIVQGFLLGVNFFLLGIPGAIFWGFVAAILSFIPVVGPPIIWIPAVVILFLSDEISKGVVLVIVGLMISTIDNILRPVINQKYGSIHPVISIIGIFIGISQFGIVGIFIGPLIVAYLILFWRIYREEYLK